MNMRRVTRTVTVIECTCLRCGYVWTPRGKGKPARCAGCTVRKWDEPAAWARPDLRKRKKKPARK